jgi:hypothetical protein
MMCAEVRAGDVWIEDLAGAPAFARTTLDAGIQMCTV